MRPNIPPGSHPVELHSYKIATRSIELMVNAVRQWIDIQLNGAIIYGTPRVGKSMAIEYVLDDAATLLGLPIPTFLFQMKDYPSFQERRFYGDLLFAVDYGLADKGDAGLRERRLVEFLLEKAQQSGTNRILQFIDDAQWLREPHYHVLMSIHNALKKKNANLIVILVGQPELLAQRNALIVSGQRQLTARLMANQLCFDAVQSVSDVKRILHGYDSESEYPSKSGWSFTRYFVPYAYEAGWRLSAHASLIWNAYGDIRQEAGLSKLTEIVTEPLTTMIDILLRDLAKEDRRDLVLDVETIKDTIRYSGYVQFEQQADDPDAI